MEPKDPEKNDQAIATTIAMTATTATPIAATTSDPNIAQLVDRVAKLEAAAARPASAPGPQQPSVGRIVILNPVSGQAVRAAVITRVFSPTCVNLVAFSECGTYTTAIRSCTLGTSPGDWSWPQRQA